jgi:hypothetical protein
MKPRQTGVNIISTSRTEEVLATELELEEGAWPSLPMAPATIWGGVDGKERVFDLHRLVELDGDTASFESFGVEVPSLLPAGPYDLISWWRPDQFEAVSDTNLVWSRRPYDGPDDDETCLLTWKSILPGDEAYVSDAGWVSVEAWEQYIRDDELRLRQP